MEIEFNPGRLSGPGGSQTVARQASTTSTDAALPHKRAQALEQTLRDAPQVRPEAVERARALVADVKYPPEEILDRLAALLAAHIQS
jgi:hypothetical protein